MNLPRVTQHDFTSRINGLSYRVMVAIPLNADGKKSFPIVYILDGNWFFRAAADAVTQGSAGGRMEPAILVGIGYPTDDNTEIGRRRTFDLTLPGKLADSTTGGGEDFIRVLLEELRPLVNANFNVDQANQSIYGMSYGGLIVLRLLFQRPEAFQSYIAASPSIWWDDKAVLREEASFSERAARGDVRARILIISAGEEQYRGTDPAKLKIAKKFLLVDNASELSARLSVIHSNNLPVVRVVIADESHGSVSLAALGRALTFALKKQ